MTPYEILDPNGNSVAVVKGFHEACTVRHALGYAWSFRELKINTPWDVIACVKMSLQEKNHDVS